MINTQYINLNMVTSGVFPVLYCSQYDVGRPLGLVVYDSSTPVDLDNYTVTVEAMRTDGTAITAAVTTDGNVGAFSTTATMTNKADKYRAQLVIIDGDENRVASLPFMIHVVEAAMDENAEAVEEDASLYQQYTGTVQKLIADIHVLLNEEAAARQADDHALISSLAAEVIVRQNTDTSLQTQINQIVTPSGGAPSAAEVQNARIGANGVTYDTLGDAIRDQVTDVTGLLKAEDDKTNTVHAFVDYDYDNPYEQSVTGSTWKTSIAVSRKLQTVELTRSTIPSGAVYIKLTGDVELENSTTNIDAWTGGISLKTGHSYRLTSELISGASSYGATYDIPVISIFEEGTHVSVGTLTAINAHKIERVFDAEEDKTYIVVMYIANGYGLFSKAKMLVTLEDLTESQTYKMQSEIDDIATKLEKVPVPLVSGNITAAGVAGGNNAYFRSYKGNLINIGEETIIVLDGDYELYNALVFSSNTIASKGKVANLTVSNIHRLEVPSEYNGQYLGITVRKTSMIGQDVSEYVEDAEKNTSVGTEIGVWEAITELQSAIDGIEHNSIPDYYFEDGYLSNKIDAINTIGVDIGKQCERSFFITDYHIEDNARQSPNLIKYLINQTGIKRVTFGGDAINHSYTSKVGGYNLLCEFMEDFAGVNSAANAFYITGNHEYNNADLAHAESEISPAVAYNLFNEPNFYKIQPLRTDSTETNSFYVDDDVTRMRTYYIDCNYGGTIPVFTVKLVADSLLTVPVGYAVAMYSHTGIGTYTSDEADPPTYTITSLNERFELIMQAMAAMDAGTSTTLSITVSGTTYTWSYDFSGKQRTFAGAFIGHSHIDSYYIYGSKYPVIATICDTGAYRAAHTHRVAGTITEQAFDVIQVDISTKRIYCTRIGYGSDRAFSFGTGAGPIV